MTAALLAAVILFTGTPMQGILDNFAMAENLYKVPDDLRAICDVIHSDTDKENPKVVFGDDLNSMARQYDASLGLVIERNYMLYRAGSKVVGTFDETKTRYKLQKRILDVVAYGEDLEGKYLKKAFYRTQTDYVVVPINNPRHETIRKTGCEALAQTENYVVYRFDWENAYEETGKGIS